MSSAGKSLRRGELVSLTGRRGSELLRGLLPAGGISEFSGPPDDTVRVVLDLSARSRTRILCLVAHDDIKRILLAQFLAAGRNPELIRVVTPRDGLPWFPNGTAKLYELIKAYQPTLLVFAPIDAFIGPRVEFNPGEFNPDPNSDRYLQILLEARAARMRELARPFAELGRCGGITSLLIRDEHKSFLPMPNAPIPRGPYSGATPLDRYRYFRELAEIPCSFADAADASFDVLGPIPSDPFFTIYRFKLISEGIRSIARISYQLVPNMSANDLETQRIEWQELERIR